MKTFDLAGQKFTQLTVVKFSRSVAGKQLWECLCDCGNTKEVNTYHLRSGKVKTCGCNQRRHKRTTQELEVFLLDRVQRKSNGCWEFTGRRQGDGYGMVDTVLFGGHTVTAHRLAAHLWLGMSMDDEKNICHHCDNPSCINPKHLFIGTQRENIQDCLRKGRNRWQHSTA